MLWEKKKDWAKILFQNFDILQLYIVSMALLLTAILYINWFGMQISIPQVTTANCLALLAAPILASGFIALVLLPIKYAVTGKTPSEEVSNVLVFTSVCFITWAAVLTFFYGTEAYKASGSPQDASIVLVSLIGLLKAALFFLLVCINTISPSRNYTRKKAGRAEIITATIALVAVGIALRFYTNVAYYVAFLAMMEASEICARLAHAICPKAVECLRSFRDAEAKQV